MKDTLILSNIGLFFVFWFFGLALFYFVIKVAVRNGVREANTDQVRLLEQIHEAVKKRPGE